MSFTETIKNYISVNCKMDMVGVAPASALADEPVGRRPEDILPGAKSIIIFGKRIPDGAIQAAFRKIEEGNLDAQSSYAAYGSELAPNMLLFFAQFNISEYIERTFGETTVPVPSGPMQNVTPVNKKLPIFMGPIKNEMILNLSRAAVAAGLGEIAWSNYVVTPENGPRQQFGAVITRLELDYDMPYIGPKLCNPEKCDICSKLCPTGAIPSCGGCSKTIEVEGIKFKVADINKNACAVASMAFRKEFAGKMDVPDLIMNNNPTDEELAEAYAKKPLSHTSLDHYPKHFCNMCLLYCPLGNWKKHFYDTGLSKFDSAEAAR